MRVLVCGSRGFTDRVAAFDVLDGLGSVTQVIEGGARGGDQVGADWARARRVPLTTVRADWDRFGRSAGFRRNEQMVAMGPDVVVALFDGERTKGTQHTVNLARQAGITVLEVGL